MPQFDTFLVYIVKDSLGTKHFIVSHHDLTLCGIERRFATPSFGKPTCAVCLGLSKSYKNGGSK